MSQNPDPITGEPGSHPVATGLGAAAASAAGLAIGTAVAGPVGTVIGGIVGAVAGAIGGHAAGEAIDPSVGYENSHLAGPEIGSFEDAEPELRAKYESGQTVLPWVKVRVATQSAWTRARAAAGRPGPPSTSGGVY